MTKMNETKLLNDTEICQKCGTEYLPEYSFHKEPGICDKCVEHEIDRVYGERGDPWADDDDDDIMIEKLLNEQH